MSPTHSGLKSFELSRGIFASTVDRVRAMGWDIHEIPTGHNAMMLEPRKLADILLALERKTAKTALK